ncbi:MAG: sterol desaturase family protein [Alphaproteobacteria bacterium]|nr:sterol desaturase family protein [Alphaproteobacteria bacterium]
MTGYLMGHEPIIRLGFFLTVFVAVVGWEAVVPRRTRAVTRRARWPNNLGISVLNTLILRLVFPVAAVGIAALGQQRGWGLLNNVAMPFWINVAVSVIVLDMAIYLQHVMFHAVPVLWRIHRVHHADIEFDVTTGLRFHPVEILLSMAIKLGVVAALGASAVGVLVFEILLNATSMFNHANASLSSRLDRVLRWVVVTPDMHRVHHSVLPEETNSNFGFNSPWWDRLFGTYRAQPRDGHDAMLIGLDIFRQPVELRLDHMLLQPFRGPVGSYPIGSRRASR